MDVTAESCRAVRLIDELRSIFGESVSSDLVVEIALHIQSKLSTASKLAYSDLGADWPCPRIYSATSLKAFGDQALNESGILREHGQVPSSRNHAIITAASDCTNHFAHPSVLLARVSSCAQTGQMLLTDATSSIPCFTAVNTDSLTGEDCHLAYPHLTPGYIGAWLLIWRFRLVVELESHRPPTCQSSDVVSRGLGSRASMYVMFDSRDIKRILAPVKCQEISNPLPLTIGMGDSVTKPVKAPRQQQIPAMPCVVLLIGKESYKHRRHITSRKVTFVLRLCAVDICLLCAEDSSSQHIDRRTKAFSVELVGEARKLMPFIHIGQCYTLRKVKERGENEPGPYGSALFINDLTSLGESVGPDGISCGTELCSALSAAKVGSLVTCLARVADIAEQPQYSGDQLQQKLYHIKKAREGRTRQRADSPQWCFVLEDVECAAFTAEAYIFSGCFASHMTGIVPGAIILLCDFLCEESPAGCTANCVLVSTSVSSVNVQVCSPADKRPVCKQLESTTVRATDSSSLPLTFVWRMACATDSDVPTLTQPFSIHGRLVHVISLSLLAQCNKCNDVMGDGQCSCIFSCNTGGQPAVTLKAKLFGIFEDGSCEFFGYAYDGCVPALLELSNQTWVAVGSHVAKTGKVDLTVNNGCGGQHMDGLAGVLLRLVQSRTFGAHKQLTVQQLPRRIRQHTDAYMVPYKACVDAERQLWATYLTKKHDMLMLKIIQVAKILDILQ